MVHLPPDPGGSRGWENALASLASIGVSPDGVEAGGLVPEAEGPRLPCRAGCAVVVPSEAARRAHEVGWHFASVADETECVLAALGAAPDGVLSTRELAAAARVRPHEVAGLVRPLVEAGLAARSGGEVRLRR